MNLINSLSNIRSFFMDEDAEDNASLAFTTAVQSAKVTTESGFQTIVQRHRSSMISHCVIDTHSQAGIHPIVFVQQ